MKGVYKRIQTLEMALSLVSVEHEVSVATNAAAAQRIEAQLRAGDRVLEVGAYIGALSACLAAAHPEVHFLATDQAPALAAVGAAAFRAPNLEIARWDYTLKTGCPKRSFDLICCVLGTPTLAESHCICRFPVPHWSDPRESVAERSGALFDATRSVAHPGTRFVAALRLGTLELVAAAVNTARGRGWMLSWADQVVVPASASMDTDQTFPLLEWTLGEPASPISETDVASQVDELSGGRVDLVAGWR